MTTVKTASAHAPRASVPSDHTPRTRAPSRATRGSSAPIGELDRKVQFQGAEVGDHALKIVLLLRRHADGVPLYLGLRLEPEVADLLGQPLGPLLRQPLRDWHALPEGGPGGGLDLARRE